MQSLGRHALAALVLLVCAWILLHLLFHVVLVVATIVAVVVAIIGADLGDPRPILKPGRTLRVYVAVCLLSAIAGGFIGAAQGQLVLRLVRHLRGAAGARAARARLSTAARPRRRCASARAAAPRCATTTRCACAAAPSSSIPTRRSSSSPTVAAGPRAALIAARSEGRAPARYPAGRARPPVAGRFRVPLNRSKGGQRDACSRCRDGVP